jgi:rRNA maturation RNase YbeY
MAQPVQFHSADKTLRLTNKTKLKQFIERLFTLEKNPLSTIHYIFCSDEYLLQMNKDFLQHDYYTDIITFGLSEKGEPIDGEVYISLDRVKDNATQHATTIERETLRVIFHGALHLCGYKDKKKEDIALMRKKEDHYINLYLKK